MFNGKSILVIGGLESFGKFFIKIKLDHYQLRFWITLQEGADFVIKSFKGMKGREVFVPNFPSMRIVDLVETMAPGSNTEIIGIRPGEKLHEILCPKDESQLTVEFDDHYVLSPSITFWTNDNKFSENMNGEKVCLVKHGFEYNSGTNLHLLQVKELQALNKMAGI